MRVTFALLFFGYCTFLTAAPGEHAAAREALKAVVEQLNELDSWLTDAEEKRASWLSEVRTTDKSIGEIGIEIQSLVGELEIIKAEIETLKTQRASLETQRLDQAKEIARHLRAAQRLSGQDFFKMLLNLETPDTFDKMVRYHQSFSEARVAALGKYRQTLASLKNNEQSANEKQESLIENHETLEKREVTLTTSRDERNLLLAELATETEDKAAQRKRLIEDQLRLEKLIAQLKKSMTTLDGAEFAASKGSLPWPITGKLKKKFGQTRSGGRLKWQGHLIHAPADTSIKAVHRGRVVFADWLRGFGLLTIIDHGDEFMTLYAHSDAILKQVGDFVESGEPIATVGSSGAQSTPGLYFELRQKGIPQNPDTWFSAR